MKKTLGPRLTLLGVILVVIDQISKILVKTNMTLGERIDVLGEWFKIVFVENNGMAFGMAFGGVVGKICLSVFRIVLCVVLVGWISRLIDRRRREISWHQKPTVTIGVLVGLTLITAGAFGNIIDCFFYGLLFSPSDFNTVAQWGTGYAPFLQGKVVDMLYFPLIDTYLPDWMPLVGGKHFTFFDPVFNFADSCVTVGAFYLVLFEHKFFSSSEEN